MKKHMSLFIIMLSIAFQIDAQTRVLPIFESPTSPTSLSLGNVRMGDLKNSFIYNNPTAGFMLTKELASSNDLSSMDNNYFLSKNYTSPRFKTADYSLGILPMNGDTHLLHTLTAGYYTNKSGFLIGGRYLSMGSIDSWLDEDMNNQTLGKKRFFSYTVDLGYTYCLNDKFSFYSTLSYAREKLVNNIDAYRLNIGGYYNGKNYLIGRQVNYSLGVAVDNVGMYSYSKKSKALAPDLKLGGSLLIPTIENQSMGLFIEENMYMPVSDNKFASSFSAGVDYTLLSKYSLRIGGHTGEHDDFLSAGFGIKYKIFDLNFGAKFALDQDLDNIYMVGLGIGL